MSKLYGDDSSIGQPTSGGRSGKLSGHPIITPSSWTNKDEGCKPLNKQNRPQMPTRRNANGSLTKSYMRRKLPATSSASASTRTAANVKKRLMDKVNAIWVAGVKNTVEENQCVVFNRLWFEIVYWL